jgi:hypothetical protein
MFSRAGTELVEELKAKFPLLRTLRFRWEASGSPDALPPAIALFAAMANPEIPGSTCVAVPSRKDVASFAAILTAFQAAVADFPGLLERYVKSFKIGERVRVLPTRHVYVFGGYLEYQRQALLQAEAAWAGVAVLLRPLDRFMLCLASGEDVVRVVLDYVIGDVSALLPTFGAGLDVDDGHLFLLVSTQNIAPLLVAAERPLALPAFTRGRG